MYDTRTNPLAEALPPVALAILDRGIGIPFPLPAGKKSAPPTGYTGRSNPRPTPEELAELWSDSPAGCNVGIWLAPGVLILDCDHYGDKTGADTLAALESAHGVLPPSYRSTRRAVSNPSGHRFYAVPEDLAWGSAGKDIDLIHAGLRYAVAPGSVVDLDGEPAEYRIYGPDGEPCALPSVEDLPELPSAWIAALSSGAAAPLKTERVGYDAAVTWLAEHSWNDVVLTEDGEPAEGLAFGGRMTEDLANPDLFGGNAHPTMNATVLAWLYDAVRYGAQNVLPALERLAARYVEDLATRADNPRGAHVTEGDFARSFTGAVSKLQAEIAAGWWTPVVQWWPDFCLAWPENAEHGSPAVRGARGGVSVGERCTAPRKGLQLVSATKTVTTEPTWLWEYNGDGGVPIGALTVFTGRGGVGKSTACRWLAAEITKGTLPGEFYGTAHNVLYIAAEESNSAMVKPSLLAHGAVEDRVFFVETDGEANRLEAQYMADLTAQCVENDVRLVVVDPMANYLHGAKLNAAEEVRKALRPWTNLAEAIGGAVVAIFHQNKSGSGDITNGIGGSAAIGQVARSVIGFDRDNDTGDCVISQDKHSLGGTMPDLLYTLESVAMPGRKRPGVRFTLGGVSSLSVGDIQVRNRQFAAGDKETAKSWLREYLSNNAPALKSDVVTAASGQYSERAIEKAAKELSVNTSRQNRKAMWSL